MQLSFD